MKILNNVMDYEVFEANFEGLRLALGFLGDKYSPAYFHGIAGTAFRIGGICPCAPTSTAALTLQQFIKLLGYDFFEIPYTNGSDEEISSMTEKVRTSVDNGVPALVWNAFTTCEWNIVTGYDENEKVFFGRAPWNGRSGNYAKNAWNKAKEEAGLVGLLAVIIKEKTGSLDRKIAEISALKEAVRHANNVKNADKINGKDWVFLEGKAAFNRWAVDFSKADKERGAGDSYCIDIYSSCHSRAGEFLREIADNYMAAKELLLKSAEFFDKEAECMKNLVPLLTWNSPWGANADRNAKVYPLLVEALENYTKAIDLIESAVAVI